MKLNKKMITGVGGGIIVVAAIVALSATGAKKKAVAEHKAAEKMEHKESARPVPCETVSVQPIGASRSFPGIVNASEESELSFRVGGPLVEVNVELGAPVKKGDLLMQIDPRDFEDRIAALEAQLAGAEAVLKNAQQDFGRDSKLFEEEVVAQSVFDRSKSTLDAAESSARGLKAQLQIARHALEDTSLVAPYDGTVTKQMAENHEMVKSGSMVLQYHNIGVLEIVVHVPENEIAAIPVGQAIVSQVTFPSLPGRTFEATLSEWSTQSNPLTRTYELTFLMTAPGDVRILPGMTAQVALAAAPESALTVPVSAVLPGASGGSAVWVYSDSSSQVELREVIAGELVGSSRMVISSGLSEGEQVVVEGTRLIHENLSLKTAAIR